MSLLNVPMRVVLGLPFETPLSGRLMLLTLIGRKSGRRYRQPVSYVQDDGDLLTPGGGRWKLNLVHDQPVPIHLRGRDVLATPRVISDVNEIERLLERMAAANPTVTAFVGVPKGPDGRLDRDKLDEAVRYGFRIIRWRLEGARQPT